MDWLKKQIAAGAVRAGAYYIITTYVLPLGVPIVTVLIGYASELPWFWIWLGALASFAFISNGLLRFDEWLDRRRVEGKLATLHPQINLIHGEHYVMGISFRNHAAFPIEVELEDLRTQIESKVPNEPYSGKRKLIVMPGMTGWFFDNDIDFVIPKPGAITGILEAKLKYGIRGTKLKHRCEINRHLTAHFDKDGNWAGKALWREIKEG